MMGFIVYIDSPSAEALARRRGVGRLKHVGLRHLGAVMCQTKVGKVEESWNEKRRGRLEYKEFECGQGTI